MLSIDERHRLAGGDSGPSGPATSPSLPTPDGLGALRIYLRGSIVWHPRLGAFALAPERPRVRSSGVTNAGVPA